MSRRFRALFACALTFTVYLAGAPSAVAQVAPIGDSGRTASETGLTALQPTDQIFTDLFKQSAGDFKRLPSKETAKWLGLGAFIAVIGATMDQPATNQLSGARSLEVPFQPGQMIGGARFQLAGALGAYTLGHATGNRKVAQVGSDLLRAQILSQAVTAGIKMAAQRTRPDGTQYSFPSGHSSVTFASATVLQRNLGWKVGIPAYAVASYVAASRIQERRHFLSDVAFGAVIGIVAGRTVTVGRGESRFAVAPMAAPGGGGVSFSWVGDH
jgi:membrane-associated phospholipid phosphatase